ncbi:MAG TPA: hypothetical protein VJ144_02725 [Candidatus Polarisedimenticolia bacterium]|nr:hypothetical protein [Candidatus Polarisedimenticolia bacterium]
MDRLLIDRGNGRRLLGDLLLEAGLTSRLGLAAGLEEQQLRGGRLGYALLKIGRVTPAALHLFLQDHLPSIDPDLVAALDTAPAVDLIPASLAHHYQMVPARVRDGVLDLAIATADSPRLIPAVEELTGLRVDPLICPPSLIAASLERSYPAEVGAGIIRRPSGDGLFVLADRKRGIRPLLPETVPREAQASEWLRAILAEGIRRGARTIRIEPRESDARIVFDGPAGDAGAIDLPRGVHPGVATLLIGLSGIAALGRVVPREGRLAIAVDGRALRASVLALPGLAGDLLRLDLREQRVLDASPEDLAADLPDLPPAVARMAEERRGVLLLAGPGKGESAAALAAVLEILGDRLPARIALGDWATGPTLRAVTPPADDEEVPLSALVSRAAALTPDLVALPEASRPSDLAAAFTLGREMAVVAALPAVDAFDAAERVVRAGLSRSAAMDTLLGIVGARLMEPLCSACSRPFDLQDLLSPWPRHRAPPPGNYAAAQGCRLCRESGLVKLQPVFEFLPVAAGGQAIRPGIRARDLRESRARQGRPLIFQAALRRAAAGRIDVREPLRLLLHEQR